MSTDLQAQIRELAQRVESSHEPVTVDEVRSLVEGREGTRPFVVAHSPMRRMVKAHGPWAAVVAAIVVILLFGALAWILPLDQPVPPADSLPHPLGAEQGYYTTSAVPDGFVLQDSWIRGESYVLYLREFDERWLPNDGGFAINGIHGRPAFLSEEPGEYLSQTRTAVPGSVEVEVAGRPGVLFETEFSQDGLTAPLVWLLAIDDQGGMFEIAAVGMSRDEVLAVANGIHRVAVEEFIELGLHITWDVRIDAAMAGFAYTPPSRVTDLAADVHVALGVDLLVSRLAGAGGENTVVTTEDGEIVETFGETIRASSVDLYVDVAENEQDELLRRYPGSAELSPEQREKRVDEYIAQIRGGEILSEDPYVVQAARRPEPLFDTGSLGDELPLAPATSSDIPFDLMFAGIGGDVPAATEDRPVIILGRVGQPNSDRPQVIILVWFTESGVTCVGTTTGDGLGSGCGFEIQSQFGNAGESTEESIDGVFGEVTYVVPMETSVVQIVTPSQTYWQRPVGGYALVPFGDTVDRPTEVIGFDALGNEVGRW